MGGLLSSGPTNTLAEPSPTPSSYSSIFPVTTAGPDVVGLLSSGSTSTLAVSHHAPTKVENRTVTIGKRKPTHNMAFHRTAVLTRCCTNNPADKQADSPGQGGRNVDPDLAAKVAKQFYHTPIHLVGKRCSTRNFDQLSSSHSSACSPGTGRHVLDAYHTEITRQANDTSEHLNKKQRFDPEMFQDFANALGFQGFPIGSSGDPLPTTGMADDSQFTNVSHAIEEPNRLSLHSNNT